ncbi:MAG: VOC family protein [Armatimonadetes bacterium]|nr:VOC family protein [Armatimonadota bacterium]
MVRPIPEGYHTITPVFVFRDSRRAIEFYKRAFGAEERGVMPGPDGKGVLHAELTIGDSIIMMSDENPFQPCKSAESLGASPVSFYLYVEDVDAAFERAVAAGAAVQMPLQDMFWGDRAGTVGDPFGHSWTLATRKQDLTTEEVAKAAEAAFGPKGG